MEDKLSMSLDDLASTRRKEQKQQNRPKKTSAADKKKAAPVKASSSSSAAPQKAKPMRELKQPTAKQLVKSDVGARSFAADSVLSRLGSKQDGTAVLISNLGYNISVGDIKELCATIGEVGKVFVNKGTADVYFRYQQDALNGIAKYNKVTLDSRPMYWALKDEVKANPQALRGASSVFSRDGPTQQRPTSAASSGKSGGGGSGSNHGPTASTGARAGAGTGAPKTVFSVTMNGLDFGNGGGGGSSSSGKGNAEKKGKQQKPVLKAKGAVASASTSAPSDKKARAPKVTAPKKEREEKAKAPAPSRSDLDDDMDGYFASRANKE